MSDAQIKGKYIIKGIITLKSPLIIGTGEDKELDIEIIKDENGKPFIPATSFAGALRHFVFDNYNTSEEWNKYFWGDIDMPSDKAQNARQSNVIFDDLTLINNNFTISTRDGIKIDYDRGVTEDKGKFDFEILEAGTSFNLFAEVNVRNNDKLDIIQQNLDAIKQSLKNENFTLGAFTTRGYGKVKSDISIYYFDFSKQEDVDAWIDYLKNGTITKQPIEIDTSIKPSNNICTLSGEFILKDSIIVGSPSADPNKPDSSMLSDANGDYVIPGSSLKGPIRSRAERILKTLDIYDSQKVRNLFGFEGEKKESGTDMPAQKSRVTVDEAVISKNNVVEKVVSRIRIDRFTGGTIEGALFDALPVWAKNNETKVNITATIKNPQDWEIGLLLLVFKDIWTGDLAFGGDKTIGRGTFKGSKLTFSYNDKSITITDLDAIPDNDKEYLNSFVKKLSQLGGKNG